MNLLANLLGRLRTVFPTQRPWTPSPRQLNRHPGKPRFYPVVEPLETREVPAAGPVRLIPFTPDKPVGCHGVSQITAQTIEIITQQRNIRLAANQKMTLVVRVTGIDHATGQPTTLTGTPDQLQAKGIDVDFEFAAGRLFRQRNVRLRRGIVANSFTFLEHGELVLAPGQRGLGFGIVATVCGTGVRSKPVQLVRDSKANALKANSPLTFQGLYQGSFQGTGTGGGFTIPVNGSVTFMIAGTTVQVLAPGSGAGAISPNGSGDFAFGGGGLNVGISGVSGRAGFSLGLTLLSSGGVMAGGTWTFVGALEDGTPVTASGTWTASR